MANNVSELSDSILIARCEDLGTFSLQQADDLVSELISRYKKCKSTLKTGDITQ